MWHTIVASSFPSPFSSPSSADDDRSGPPGNRLGRLASIEGTTIQVQVDEWPLPDPPQAAVDAIAVRG